MEKTIFDIAGMRCGACAVGIELMLTKKKGVKSAKVSLNERIATVEYNPAIVAASDIAKAVSDIGYIASARS
jgi:copper chaperone CopZ